MPRNKLFNGSIVVKRIEYPSVPSSVSKPDDSTPTLVHGKKVNKRDLGSHQVHLLRASFFRHKEGRGRVRVKDIPLILQQLKLKYSLDDIGEGFIAQNGSKAIRTVDELLNVVQKYFTFEDYSLENIISTHKMSLTEVEFLQRRFTLFDTRHENKINVIEFVRLCTSLGIPLTSGEAFKHAFFEKEEEDEEEEEENSTRLSIDFNYFLQFIASSQQGT